VSLALPLQAFERNFGFQIWSQRDSRAFKQPHLLGVLMEARNRGGEKYWDYDSQVA